MCRRMPIPGLVFRLFSPSSPAKETAGQIRNGSNCAGICLSRGQYSEVLAVQPRTAALIGDVSIHVTYSENV